MTSAAVLRKQARLPGIPVARAQLTSGCARQTSQTTSLTGPPHPAVL